MPRVVWTSAALRDLARLHSFLAPKNPDAARRAIAIIRQGVKLLSEHPEVGRPAETMPLGFREWPIGFGAYAYLALYRLDGSNVVILAIRHGRELGY